MHYIAKSPSKSKIKSTRFWHDSVKGDAKKVGAWVSSHRKTFENIWYWTNSAPAEMVLTINAHGYLQVIGTAEELAGFILRYYPAARLLFTCSNVLRNQFYDLLGTWEEVTLDQLNLDDTIRIITTETVWEGVDRLSYSLFAGEFVAWGGDEEIAMYVSNTWPDTKWYSQHHFTSDNRWFKRAHITKVLRLKRKETR